MTDKENAVAPDADVADRGGIRTSDPEVAAMGRVVRALDGLDADAQRRVVLYLHQRYLPGLYRAVDEVVAKLLAGLQVSAGGTAL